MTITTKNLLAGLTDQVEFTTKRVKIFRLNQKKVTATVAFVEKMLERFVDDKLEVHAWPDISTWGSTVTLQYFASAKVVSMKVGTVPNVLRFLLEAGFEAEASTDSLGDTYAYRVFDFKKPATATTVAVDFKFTAKIPEGNDSKLCHREKVGVEVREVPVYKLICDEPEATPNAI